MLAFALMLTAIALSVPLAGLIGRHVTQPIDFSKIEAGRLQIDPRGILAPGLPG